jgi:hypothetical protein
MMQQLFQPFQVHEQYVNSSPPRLCYTHLIYLQLELNEFADMTWQDFARTRLGFDATKHAERYTAVVDHQQ